MEAVADVPHETLQELSNRVAIEYGIATTTLANLVWSESKWDPNKDNGDDRGLVQINRYFNPGVTDEQAFDPEFSLRFAAQKIAEGNEYLWTVCNCYSYVKLRIPNLPATKDLIPNSPPRVGSVALFDYHGKKHYVFVETLGSHTFSFPEANFEPCLVSRRSASYDDPFLVGYWHPEGNPHTP